VIGGAHPAVIDAGYRHRCGPETSKFRGAIVQHVDVLPGDGEDPAGRIHFILESMNRMLRHDEHGGRLERVGLALRGHGSAAASDHEYLHEAGVRMRCNRPAHLPAPLIERLDVQDPIVGELGIAI